MLKLKLEIVEQKIAKAGVDSDSDQDSQKVTSGECEVPR